MSGTKQDRAGNETPFSTTKQARVGISATAQVKNELFANEDCCLLCAYARKVK